MKPRPRKYKETKSDETHRIYASPVKLVRSTILLELTIRVLFRWVPSGVRRALAGRPILVDDQTLDPDLQLLLRLERLTDAATPARSPQRRREHQDVATALAAGPPVQGVTTASITIPGAGHPERRSTPARLYTPAGLAAGSPLLVFLHGGGWVLPGAARRRPRVGGRLPAGAGGSVPGRRA
jgi:acetyl esterase